MSGGVHIAYQVFGEGPFDLVFVPGFISHVEMNWELAYWRDIFGRLSRFCRVIIFDKRGTGLSDRVGAWPTFEERMDDVRAVMDAAGSEQAVLWGTSEGGPMCMLFAALYPERTRALVLRGSGPRFGSGPEWPWGWSAESGAPMLDAAEQIWGTGAVMSYFLQGLADDPRSQAVTGRYERFAASPGCFRQLLEMDLVVDVREILSAISAPTLVLHRVGDYIVPIEAGRYTAEHIKNAILIELPGDFHLSARPGDEDEAMDAVEQFLTGTRSDREIDRMLATVLFTDIVGSTERAAALGDRRWRDLLAEHHRRVRVELDRFRGKEIDTAGDSFLATFDGPARALRCAQAIRTSLADMTLGVRAGLHSGEVEVIGDDIGGIAVHIGARVAALAAPDEILVSRTVVDLVVGSGIEFDDRGEHDLKGVPGAWRLFAVKG
jgi:pimeloyl-ACP methyl ester carboxylesterase